MKIGITSFCGKPLLIGVAGPSCAGKTMLAQRLAGSLESLSPVVLCLDSYYADLSHLESAERDRRNFDSPAAMDSELLLQHMRALAEGRTIQKPVYDFSTHTRAQRREPITPGACVIVEGLFTLYWEQLREIFHTRVFVSVKDELALFRRQIRDTQERGRTPATVLAQYTETVRPMCERYILPTRRYADVIVHGSDPVGDIANAVMVHLKNEVGVS